ncbi:hypothetical protein AXF42_Ash020596 [Apostasia shenzhenica]|uniref:Uncharacterized protein n=1 Tax=Apostasia shenzhenica TaxID=1088818 RepID=A0A2I0A0F2_9ASPA|nr:hypothetical protein AXF42_Ash020596 [Apostasia shenzhenica]
MLGQVGEIVVVVDFGSLIAAGHKGDHYRCGEDRGHLGCRGVDFESALSHGVGADLFRGRFVVRCTGWRDRVLAGRCRYQRKRRPLV